MNTFVRLLVLVALVGVSIAPALAQGPTAGPPAEQERMVRMMTMMGEMWEQMRQMQELMREYRELRESRNGDGLKEAADQRRETPLKKPESAEARDAAPPLGGSSPPAAAKLPTPTVTSGPAAKTLADAHEWLLERLAKLSQPQAPK